MLSIGVAGVVPLVADSNAPGTPDTNSVNGSAVLVLVTDTGTAAGAWS